MGGVSEGSMPGATVEVVKHPDELLVKLGGEIDLTNIGALEAPIAPFLDDPDVQKVVFDMADLGFMDSSAIAVLLRVAGTGKAVRLRRPSPIVHEVVTTMGLAGILQVEP